MKITTWSVIPTTHAGTPSLSLEVLGGLLHSVLISKKPKQQQKTRNGIYHRLPTHAYPYSGS